MKALINEVYQSPMRPELQRHLLYNLGLTEDDRKIITSLISHDADSNFHYEATGMNRDKFERRLNRLNRVIFPELVRLANEACRITTK